MVKLYIVILLQMIMFVNLFQLAASIKRNECSNLGQEVCNQNTKCIWDDINYQCSYHSQFCQQFSHDQQDCWRNKCLYNKDYTPSCNPPHILDQNFLEQDEEDQKQLCNHKNMYSCDNDLQCIWNFQDMACNRRLQHCYKYLTDWECYNEKCFWNPNIAPQCQSLKKSYQITEQELAELVFYPDFQDCIQYTNQNECQQFSTCRWNTDYENCHSIGQVCAKYVKDKTNCLSNGCYWSPQYNLACQPGINMLIDYLENQCFDLDQQQCSEKKLCQFIDNECLILDKQAVSQCKASNYAEFQCYSKMCLWNPDLEPKCVASTWKH